MPEFIENAKEELKRVDHLIYVSLKYTRTVDVLKSIIQRLLNCFDFVIEGLLQEAEDNNKIEATPTSPGVKCEVLQKLYSKEKTLHNYCSFYLLLRRINRAEFERAREFRRHVTMTANVDQKLVEVNIDIITDYFKRVKLFMDYVNESLVKEG
jgi:hypothetical protein